MASAYPAPVQDGHPFGDLLAANDDYAAAFSLSGLRPRAAKGLAILTCMDSRIEPLSMLGLRPGDAKILRNAGARVTGDVLQTLVLAVYLLGVERLMVVAHTDCQMASRSEAELQEAVRGAGGPDIRSLAYRVAADQEAALRADVQRVRSWPYLTGVEVGGFVYDVDTGRLGRVC